ncbi:hypothetical protein [Paenibacillus sp. 1P03SA]|uniref:hypothetical protein n=1 Tax=Paenibacillus sp. 1P03SA TaxID=3132294 RepID=UPI0039A2EA10
MDARIIRIELFEFDVPCCYHYAKGTLENCRYGLLKLTDEAGETGWGECLMAVNEKYFDLVTWARFLYRLQKTTTTQALDIVRLNRVLWGNVKADLAEMALFDLISRSRRKPFVEVLGSYGGAGYYGSCGRSVTSSFSARPAAVLNEEGGLRSGPEPRYRSRSGEVARIEIAVSAQSSANALRTEREIHPGCGGSLLDDLRSAYMLRQEGTALAMHKDYLIGPACCLWEHTAAVLGADWLEEGGYPEPARLAPVQTCGYIGTGFQLDQPALFEQSRAYFIVL